MINAKSITFVGIAIFLFISLYGLAAYFRLNYPVVGGALLLSIICLLLSLFQNIGTRICWKCKLE
jgi:hypothetical protein